MAVRKIGSSWWVDFRWKHTRNRKRSPINTRAGALEYESVLRSRLARGESLETRSPIEPRFDTFATSWMETYVRTNNRHSTIYAKTCILRRHLVPAFGTMTLTRIDSAQIERYKAARLSEGLSSKTINGHISVLHTALQTAADWGLLSSVPRIRWLKVPPLSYVFLSVDECERLLAAAANERWRTMILCGLRTGMRFGELTALEWSDIDLGRNLITVRRNCVRGVVGTPKNNRIRHIPIATDLATALAEMKNDGGLIFTVEDGNPVRTDTGLRWLDRACSRAGIRHIGWHVLRHTFASHLVARGVPIRTVQVLLGHSTIQMTERYSHLAPSSLEDAINVLVTHERGILGNRWSIPTQSHGEEAGECSPNFAE